MMKKMKCFWSFLIVMIMLTAQTGFFTTVCAEDTENAPLSVTVTDEDLLRAEKLEAFGAITNEHKDVGMYVTRRQMADIIVTFMRLNVSGIEVIKSPFLDVSIDDPSVGAISALYNSGIITGNENLQFHPDDYLIYDDALVFIVNAIGYKFFAAREGGYPTGYHRIAIRQGMLKGLKFDSGRSYIPLCDVYKMLDAAMDSGAVIPSYLTDGTVDYSVSKDESFLSDLYDIEKHQGIITGNEFTHLTVAESALTDEQIEINGVVYDTPGYVYADSLGCAVNYYLRKTADGDFDIAFVEENRLLNHAVKVDSEDLIPDKTTESRIYYTNDEEKERHINLSVNVDVIYNNQCYRGYGKIADILPEYGYIEALDNTGDSAADVLFIYNYKNIVVGAVDTYENSLTSLYADESGVFEKYLFDDDEKSTTFILMPEHKKVSLEKLRRWDVATVLESKANPAMYTVYISRETVTGLVTEMSGENGCLINGAYYKTAEGYTGDEIKVGSNASFLLDFNQRIVAMDKTSVTASGSLGVLTGIDYGGGSLMAKAQVRMFSADGTLFTAPLDTDLNLDGLRYTTGKEGLEKTLKYLSGGAKNDAGQYYIETPYIVNYKLKDGKVSYLDTGKTGEEGKLHKFAEGDQFLTRPGNILKALNGTANVGDWIYTYYKPGETVIFKTPSVDELEDEDLYSVTNVLEDEWYYRDSAIYGEQYTRHTDSYVMYNYTSEGIDSARVILLIGGSGSSGSGIHTTRSPLKVVTKLTKAVDRDGAPTKKVYLDGGTSFLFAEKINIKVGAEVYENVNVTQIDTYLKPGTTIQYGTDKYGAISTLSIITDYDAETGAVTRVFDDVGVPSDWEEIKMCGIVTEISPADGILRLEMETGGSTAEYILPIGSNGISVYRPDREKTTVGNASSIAVGDYIVARMVNYYSVCELIVFKQ